MDDSSEIPSTLRDFRKDFRLGAATAYVFAILRDLYRGQQVLGFHHYVSFDSGVGVELRSWSSGGQ